MITILGCIEQFGFFDEKDEKNKYQKPKMIAERFIPNDYAAVCPEYWYLEDQCYGSVYHDTDGNGLRPINGNEDKVELHSTNHRVPSQGGFSMTTNPPKSAIDGYKYYEHYRLSFNGFEYYSEITTLYYVETTEFLLQRNDKHYFTDYKSYKNKS